MPEIYTAQYRYSGPDRLDITVKGQDPVGRIFAPTWEMVLGIKNAQIDSDTYTHLYHSMMMESWASNRPMWEGVEQRIKEVGRITLVCFCPAGKFCHRRLLAEIFSHLGFGDNKGEVPV